jgi:hypothetical protein
VDVSRAARNSAYTREKRCIGGLAVTGPGSRVLVACDSRAPEALGGGEQLLLSLTSDLVIPDVDHLLRASSVGWVCRGLGAACPLSTHADDFSRDVENASPASTQF